MKINYKNKDYEILKTGDIQINKDFVEIWTDKSQIANFEKDNDELKVEFYYNHEKIYELPISLLKEAIKAAEEFIED